MEAVINYWAILVSAVLAQVIGALWYSKYLFADVWMKHVKIDFKKMKPEVTPFIVAFVGALVMAYVLSYMVDYAEALSVLDGLIVAAWIWLGFVFTPEVISSQFNKKPFELVLIDTGHYLAVLVMMGGILAVWV